MSRHTRGRGAAARAVGPVERRRRRPSRTPRCSDRSRPATTSATCPGRDQSLAERDEARAQDEIRAQAEQHDDHRQRVVALESPAHTLTVPVSQPRESRVVWAWRGPDHAVARVARHSEPVRRSSPPAGASFPATRVPPRHDAERADAGQPPAPTAGDSTCCPRPDQCTSRSRQRAATNGWPTWRVRHVHWRVPTSQRSCSGRSTSAPGRLSPASGATADRWELLATVAAQDLTVARVLEPHLDAVAILAEDGQEPAPSRRGGSGRPKARSRVWSRSADDAGRGCSTGRKPWCSLAGLVSHALVTAWVDDDERRLFAVDLAHGVPVEDGTWVPRDSPRCHHAGHDGPGPGVPVGATGWYLERDGFWWGGIGVAAVWYGGAVGLARRLATHVDLPRTRPAEPDASRRGGCHPRRRTFGARRRSRPDRRGATGREAALLGARVVTSSPRRSRTSNATSPTPWVRAR